MRASSTLALFAIFCASTLTGCNEVAREDSLGSPSPDGSEPVGNAQPPDALPPVESTDMTPTSHPVGGGSPSPAPMVVINRSALPEPGTWLTGGDSGTLTREALSAVLSLCEAIGNRPRDCAARVTNRTGPFAAVDELAAAETALLLGVCRETEELSDCRQEIEDERYIRDQAIGRAEPNTLAMRQYEEIVWSVNIRRSELNVTPGEVTITETNPDGETVAVDNAISFTEETCFLLEYNPDEFKVGDVRSCPEYRRGNTPYTARWTIEPLVSGERDLTVVAVHERDGRQVATENVPTSPFTIEVEHWLVNVLRELGLWNEVAAAIGTLMATIAGWGIWKLFRRRKETGDEDDQT